MVCSSTMDAKHSVAIFSSFPNRISSIIDLPVVAGVGISQYICRPCNKKFLAGGLLPRKAGDLNLAHKLTGYRSSLRK